MRFLRRSILVTAAVVAGSLALIQCGEGKGTSPADVNLSIAEMEAFVQDNVALVPGLGLGLYGEIVKVLRGETVDGVTVEDRGNGQFDVSAQVDADGVGEVETSLSATADVTKDGDGNIVRVILDILDFVGPGGIGASGEIDQEVIGGGSDPDRPILAVRSSGLELTLAGGAVVQIPDMGYTLDLTFDPGFVEGFIDFEVGDVSATIFFEADGQGGWRTRVAGTKDGEPFEFST